MHARVRKGANSPRENIEKTLRGPFLIYVATYRRVFKLVHDAKGTQERVRGILIGDASCVTAKVSGGSLHMALRRLFS